VKDARGFVLSIISGDKLSRFSLHTHQSSLLVTSFQRRHSPAWDYSVGR